MFSSWPWVALDGKIWMQPYTYLCPDDTVDVIFHLADSSVLLDDSEVFKSHLHDLEENSIQ